jgi:DHA1 family bicyclomycin/chloramphenicol resistance-like MFS transporter
MTARTAVDTSPGLEPEVTEPVDSSHAISQSVGDAMTRRQRLVYVLLLGALVALGPFTIDLYLPAFPAVAADLLASDAAIQLTLTATAVGFALGQLIVGPLSDAVGRRKPLLIATGVHIFASLCVAIAPTVEWIMAGRVLQGIGAAGGGVVAMAVVRDLFGGQQLIKMLSRLVLVMGFAPVVAPVLGSQLLRVFEWRGIFVVLAAYGLMMLVLAAVFLRETLAPERRGPVSGAMVARRYRKLLGDPGFIGVSIVGAATFTALFSYLSASSFVLQDQLGLTPQQFGYVFAINSVGLIFATQVSARLMRRFPPSSVTILGLGIMSAGAVALLIGALLGTGLVGLVIPLVFVVGAAGLVFPTVQVMALADHPAEAGTAAALIGAVNMGVAGLISPLVGVLGNTAIAMASVILGALVIGQASLWLIVRRRTPTEVLV